MTPPVTQPEIAARISALDQQITEHRADQEHCQRRIEIHATAIERLEFGKRAYLDAAEIMSRGCSVAVLAAAPNVDEVPPPLAADGESCSGQTAVLRRVYGAFVENERRRESAAADPQETTETTQTRRKRRDVRALAREHLAHQGVAGQSARGLAAALDISTHQAVSIIGWLRERGELAPADGSGVVRLATSVDAAADDARWPSENPIPQAPFPAPDDAAPAPESPTAEAPEKTAEQVLDFLRRCGDMGAGEAQLRMIKASAAVLAALSERGLAYLDDDERWYAEPVGNADDGAEMLDVSQPISDIERDGSEARTPDPSLATADG